MKKKQRRQSGEFKVIAAIIAVLAVAYAFQLMFAPSPKAAPTGLVVADLPSAPTSDAISIISPAKSSVQSSSFNVKIAVGSNTATCYYRTDDYGRLTWDRRMKPCALDFAISPDYCKTKGVNTCKLYVEAADANGNILGSDTAYFSLQ